MSGEDEGAELSTDEELEGGGAVTVDPEEEEEVDLGMVAAAAGASGASGASDPAGLSGALDSWVEPPAGTAGVDDRPSGRAAVPGRG